MAELVKASVNFSYLLLGCGFKSRWKPSKYFCKTRVFIMPSLFEVFASRFCRQCIQKLKVYVLPSFFECFAYRFWRDCEVMESLPSEGNDSKIWRQLSAKAWTKAIAFRFWRQNLQQCSSSPRMVASNHIVYAITIVVLAFSTWYWLSWLWWGGRGGGTKVGKSSKSQGDAAYRYCWFYLITLRGCSLMTSSLAY